MFFNNKKKDKNRTRNLQNSSLCVCIFSVWLVQSLPRAVSLCFSFTLLPPPSSQDDALQLLVFPSYMPAELEDEKTPQFF